MLYAVVIATAMMACCYLLFRRGNAFAPEVISPTRLRRWAAVLFAAFALNHIWYMPIFFLTSSEDIMMNDLIGGLLDCMTLFPVAIIVLLAMLQDHKRPLWPVAAMVTPIVVAGAWSVATRSYALLPMVYVYFLLMCMGFIIYMVRALRQYGRWLRDNFADLEYKEVWQSFLVLAIIMLVFAFYVFTSEGPVYQYAMQVIVLVLVCYLLWRVETLSDLSIPFAPTESETGDYQSSTAEDNGEYQQSKGLSQTNRDNIGALLQKHCIDTHLYLQHDLNLLLLAKAIGTNRLYLSQYFSTQGITYNAYINNLRINHFVSLYREAVAASRPFTAQQLANESGYQSYSTFRHAFKLRMGQNVREWMGDTTPNCQNQQK
jgi:AraC-like DNA-binding protein